jgi:hypothetical protein
VADAKALKKDFAPGKIRDALDGRDGLTTKMRKQLYDFFSRVTCHPTMSVEAMLCPLKKGPDGPFLDPRDLQAAVSELGRLAVQAGNVVEVFMPNDWDKGAEARKAFRSARAAWMTEFYDRLPAPKCDRPH